MLLLSLLLPPLIISLPQSLSKISSVPSTLKSVLDHFRSSPPHTAPIDSTAPIERTPELIPGPIDDIIVPEPLKPAYAPLIYAGKDAWRILSEDPVEAWEKGNKEHVWFFWFSGVEVGEGAIGAPLIEGTEWPELVEGTESGELEMRRRRLEVGLFKGNRDDEVYRETAIDIGKRQQQEQFEQEQAAYSSSVSSTSTSSKTSTVDPIIFSSETPVVPPPSYAHFAFVNCNDEEERPLCHRFLAIKEHRPMLYTVVRNTTVIEPVVYAGKVAEPEVVPLMPEFVHTNEHENISGMTQQLGDDAVVHVDPEEDKAMDEDPVVEEEELEPPQPAQPTIIHKLILRKVSLNDNLTTTDLQNFYEFKRWEKLTIWGDVLNPADGLIGTAMDGKVGEIIGMGYEYWYKTPKWAFGMVLALLLRWITVSILDRGHQRNERKRAEKRRRKQGALEAAAAAAAEAAHIPLKAQVILPEVPEVPEIPVETQVPEEIEVVEHAELAKAEEVASIAEVLDKAEIVEDIKPELKKDEAKDEGEGEVEVEANGEAKDEVKDQVKKDDHASPQLEDKTSMEDL